jgi:hypothetical protein
MAEYTRQDIQGRLDSGGLTPGEREVLEKALDSAPEEKTVKGFGSNFVDSAVEFGKDFVQMPIDAVSMIADGGGDLLRGEDVDIDTDNPTAAGVKALMTEDGRAALGHYYVNRYGSIDGLQEAMYKDPVGVLSDVAMFAMPAMAAKNVAKVAGKAGVKGADTVADAFERAQKTLDKFDPINATGLAATTAVNKLGKDDYAQKLYQEIIKPSNSYSQEQKTNIITHMLDNGITPDGKGVDTAQARISDALAQSDKIIDGSDATMPAGDIMGYYDQQATPSPQAINSDATAVGRSRIAQGRVDELNPHFGNTGPDGPVMRPDLTAEQVRDQRRVFDGEVSRDKAGKANTSSDNAKLDVGQADYLREQLGIMVPEIKPLNRQISMDIPAKQFAEKAATQWANNNTFGLSDAVSFSGGDGLLGSLGRVASSMALRSPKNRAKLARYVHSAKNDPLMMRDAPLLNTGRNLLQFEGRQGEYVAELLREEEERRKREQEGIY